MLARSMTEFLPPEQLEDVLVYRNQEDENEPKVRTVPAGRGSRLIAERRAHVRQQRERTNRTLLFIALVVGAALLLATISSGEILTFIFGSFILVFGLLLPEDQAYCWGRVQHPQAANQAREER